MFSCGRTRGVEQALLRQQDERLLRVLAAPHRFLRCGDLLQAASYVYGSGVHQLAGFPRDGLIQGVIDLEYTRSVAIALHLSPVARGKRVPGHRQQLPGSDIEQRQAARGKFTQALHRPSGGDLPSERLEIACQRIGDGLRPSACQGPAGAVPQDAFHDGKG